MITILDGATGTELEARGVPMILEGWSALAQLDHPDVLLQLHSDYIEAGADVVITNTFGAGRHLMEPGGRGHLVEAAIREAVAIARDAAAAADREITVAGSISTYMADHHDPNWLDRLDQTYTEQVELLLDGGVDVIALEMMQEVLLARPAVEAASECGVPVWLGISTMTRDGTVECIDPPHDPLVDVLPVLLEPGVDVVHVMHTLAHDVHATLDVVERYWDGPIGVYPECGWFEAPHWQFEDIIEPSVLADEASTWVDRGVTYVGGCCGTNVEHIRGLSRRFR